MLTGKTREAQIRQVFSMAGIGSRIEFFGKDTLNRITSLTTFFVHLLSERRHQWHPFAATITVRIGAADLLEPNN